MAATTVVVSGCAVTPDNLSTADIVDFIQTDRAVFQESQEPITDTVNLSEAMARAVKYNLDHRLTLMEEAVAQGQLTLAQYDMLPNLALTAQFDYRSPEEATVSEPIATRQRGTSYSTSDDQFKQLADVRLTWNLLDFGVGYLQAKQEADRYIIAQNARRRVMMNLLLQVRAAYWRALSASLVSDELVLIRGDAQIALAELDVSIAEGAFTNNVDALQEKRVLLEFVNQLDTASQQLRLAKLQFSTLLNEPPGKEITLAKPRKLALLPRLPKGVEDLEIMALHNSSDYRDQILNARIEQAEARKALLRMLPGIEFSLGANYDSNSFLYRNSWMTAGSTLTWNLFRVASYPTTARVNETREQLAELSRLAVNMATIAQIHISYQRYQDSKDKYERAVETARIVRQISDLTTGAQSAQTVGVIPALQARVEAVFSELDQLSAYADQQEAYGSLLVSLSLNPVPDNYHDYDVETLANIIEAAMTPWEEGQLPSIDIDNPLAPAPVQTELDATQIDVKPSQQDAPEDEDFRDTIYRWFGF